MLNNEENSQKILKRIIIGLAGFAIVLSIFGAGVFVGGLKARFSYQWAESYHKNFAGPRGGFFGDWQKAPPFPGGFTEGYGVFGEIIKTDPSTSSGQVAGFVIKGQDDVEKIIVTTKETIIKKGRETIKEGLKIGDQVVIIGSPNEQGQIEAKLIRFFDAEAAKGFPFKRPQPRFF